jgi:hypothetical protein
VREPMTKSEPNRLLILSGCLLIDLINKGVGGEDMVMDIFSNP